MNKWKVRKRDGVWLVFDHGGTIRFACDNHRMALSFAFMKGKATEWVRPVRNGDVAASMYMSWREALRRAIQVRLALEQDTDPDEDR